MSRSIVLAATIAATIAATALATYAALVRTACPDLPHPFKLRAGANAAPQRDPDIGTINSGATPGTTLPQLWDPEAATGSGAPLHPDVAARVLAQERQGKGARVVALSVWGNRSRDTQGVVENAVLARRDWAGWRLRVYVGDGVPAATLDALGALGAELVRVDPALQRDKSGALWRFLPMLDGGVARFVVRDADSRLTRRDRAAVEEWVASGRLMHVMHDNPWHGNAKHPVMAGMWGAVNGLINPSLLRGWLDELRANSSAAVPQGSDQDWLAGEVWPHARNFTLQHASFQCGAFGAAESRGFPTQRESLKDFVGNIYDADNQWQGMNVHQAECPQQCRRKPEWTNC